MGDRTYVGLERALDWSAVALLYLLVVSGVAAGAAALLADCPVWLGTTVALVGCAFLAVCLVSELVDRVAHVPRLEQAAAELGFVAAPTEIPAERRPEPARDEVRNEFRGDWDGHDVQLFEFDFVWHTTEHKHRATPLCAGVRVRGDFDAVNVEPRVRFVHPASQSDEPFARRYVTTGPAAAEMDFPPELRRWLGEHPGEWDFRLDGPWLFCWRVPEVDSAEGIAELVSTLVGFAERLKQNGLPRGNPLSSGEGGI